MFEKDMEELIATYPNEFFPRNEFRLIGRQGAFSGVGRYDLLFEDLRGTKILMELKARPAKYKDADQLAKYNDELKRRGIKNVILWLVATNIPQSIRDFLDNVGIEYTEIHENEYFRIAKKVNYKFDNNFHKTSFLDVGVGAKKNYLTNKTFWGGKKMYKKSKLSKDFKNSLEKMRNFFEEAYNFLYEIGSGVHDGFWLSTAKNAHLYYNDAFYMYIKISPMSIELHSNYNGRIDTQTKDNSNKIFFAPIKKIIEEMNGFNEGWATIYGFGFYLSSKTPPEFFKKLLELIKNSH